MTSSVHTERGGAMTKDRAIEVLKEMKNLTYVATDSRCSALDMAIESLSAEPKCKKCAIKELWKATEKEDLVAVVRCGDCKFLMPSGLCTAFADECIRPSASDFCSYGERREE